MQVINSVHRAEITFWTAMIALMNNQRLVRLAIITSLFLLCLGVLGIADLTLNHNAAPSPQRQVVSVSPPQAVAAIPPQEQRNILVILVDSLTATDPSLEGLWLVGKLPSSPHLVFFPIFPSPRGAAVGKWSGVFGLDGDGLPSAEFVEDLQTKNIKWDNYLVVDHASLADLIELAGRISWNGQPLNGQDMVAKLPLPLLEPQAALQTQAFVAQELCHSAAALIQSADPALIWGLLTHRMRSDLELTSIQAAQNDLALIVGGPTCEFPTFQEISSLTGAE